jgi:chromate transporter
MTMRATVVDPARSTLPPPSSVTALDLARYFAWLGTVGFGGPVVLVERMRRDLQEARRWYSDAEYREGLALAQLAPGPLAAQLAIYLGWVRRGVLGATVAGLAFIGPSFLMVLVLSAAYVRFGGLPWMRGAFYGIGAVVIALVTMSAWRLMRRTVGGDRLLWFVVALNAVATAWTERETVWLFVASGAFVWAIRRFLAGPIAAAAALGIPPWLLTGSHGEQTPRALASILGYFTRAGAVVFGSGLAIVPFLHGGVVQEMHWLTERQFLDAVAVSMITPGPVVITVAFIGYLVAGPLGACAAAIGVFVPVYVVVVGVARWFHLIARNRSLRAAVDGVTAAAIGAITGAVIVLGRRALTDVATWAMFAAAVALIVGLKGKLPEPALILAAGVAGVALRGFGT